MSKLRNRATATLLLAILAGLSLPAAAQDGPPGPFATTTTLSISGKPTPGATVTLTAAVTGSQFVFNLAGGTLCNAYSPNSVTIYNGSTAIGSTQLTTLNATATVTENAIFVNDGTCVYEDQFWTTATSYKTTYTIPQNATSVNLRAVFTPASGSYSLASQSATLAYQLAEGLTSFVLPSGEQHWGFVGANGDVYNLYWSSSAGYHFNDASAAANAPKAYSSALTSYTLASGEQHWGFIGTNGDVYNLYWSPSSSYLVADASAAAGAPQAASGALTSFTLPSGEQHWAYIGTNGDVYDLYWSGGTYYVANISAATGAPQAASGALTSFTLPSGEEHWAYIGTNGDVYDLYWSGGTYYIANISAATGAPQAASGALTSFTLPSGEQHWGYIGTNGDVYNLYWSAGSYYIGDVSAAAGAPQATSGALTSFTLPSGEQHWGYIGTNGDVYNLYWSAGSYYVGDVSAAAGAP
jgi:hypothetical protein